jgi:hypothetical protein
MSSNLGEHSIHMLDPPLTEKPFNFKVGSPGGKHSERRQIDHSKCTLSASSRTAKFLDPCLRAVLFRLGPHLRPNQNSNRELISTSMTNPLVKSMSRPWRSISPDMIQWWCLDVVLSGDRGSLALLGRT